MDYDRRGRAVHDGEEQEQSKGRTRSNFTKWIGPIQDHDGPIDEEVGRVAAKVEPSELSPKFLLVRIDAAVAVFDETLAIGSVEVTEELQRLIRGQADAD